MKPRIIHVSHGRKSIDNAYCGSIDQPCFHLIYAINEISQDNDVIVLGACYEYHQNVTFSVPRSLELSSYRGAGDNCREEKALISFNYQMEIDYFELFSVSRNLTLCNVSIGMNFPKLTTTLFMFTTQTNVDKKLKVVDCEFKQLRQSAFTCLIAYEDAFLNAEVLNTKFEGLPTKRRTRKFTSPLPLTTRKTSNDLKLGLTGRARQSDGVFNMTVENCTFFFEMCFVPGGKSRNEIQFINNHIIGSPVTVGDFQNVNMVNNQFLDDSIAFLNYPKRNNDDGQIDNHYISHNSFNNSYIRFDVYEPVNVLLKVLNILITETHFIRSYVKVIGWQRAIFKLEIANTVFEQTHKTDPFSIPQLAATTGVDAEYLDRDVKREIVIRDSVFKDASAGAIDTKDYQIVIINSNFLNNYLTHDELGYAASAAISIYSYMTIIYNCTILNNTSTYPVAPSAM